MARSFRIHDLLQIELVAPEGEFSDYVNLEFGHWSVTGEDSESEAIPTISICLDSGLYREGTVWALGKGIFLNGDTDEIYVSQDRGTSFFNPDTLYASLDQVHVGTPGSPHMQVTLNSAVLGSGGVKSRLRELKRRLRRQDPRSLQRRISEKFVSQYVEPNVFRQVLRSGWLMLHAAALARGDHGIQIFGPQNVGKTTVTIGLARNGWKMLGDDLCLMDRSGAMRSYPKPLKLEREFIRNAGPDTREAALHHGRSDSALSSLSAGIWESADEFEIKVPPSVLDIELADESVARTVFFLRRVSHRKNDRNIEVEQIAAQDAIALCEQHIAAEYDVNKHLDRDIRQNLALHYHLKGDQSVVTPQVSEIIEGAFSDVDAYLLTINDPSADVSPIIEDIIGHPE